MHLNGSNKTFHLQWHLTERCNLRCRHCYVDEKLVKEELPFKAVKDILGQYFSFIAESGITRNNTRVSFTGGEPFFRKDIFDIIEVCYKNYQVSRYGVLCNGYFLSDENVARMRALKVDYAQVSIEGSEKNNDSLRGKGSYSKALEGVKRLLNAGISTSISMTVHKKNVKDVPVMIELAKKLKVDALGIRRLIPAGRGKAMTDLMLTPPQIKDLYKYILSVKESDGSRFVTIGCEDGIMAQTMHYQPNGCLCGYHSLTILPNGEVYPCRRLPVLAGDLRKTSLKDIFLSSEALCGIRDIGIKEKECLRCPFFNECLGGAKCVSYSFWGRLGKPDPQCWRLFDELPAIKKTGGRE